MDDYYSSSLVIILVSVGLFFTPLIISKIGEAAEKKIPEKTYNSIRAGCFLLLAPLALIAGIIFYLLASSVGGGGDIYGDIDYPLPDACEPRCDDGPW